MNTTKQCQYNDQRVVFHGFFQRAYPIGGSLMVGGYPAGQVAYPCAVIEMNDGKVKMVGVEEINFLNDRKENTND